MERSMDSVDVLLTTNVAGYVNGAVDASDSTEVPATVELIEQFEGATRGCENSKARKMIAVGETIKRPDNGSNGDTVQKEGPRSVEVSLTSNNDDPVGEEINGTHSNGIAAISTFSHEIEGAGNGSQSTEVSRQTKDYDTVEGAIVDYSKREVSSIDEVCQAFGGSVNDNKNTEGNFTARITDTVHGAVDDAAEPTLYIVPAIIGGRDVVTSSTFDVIAPGSNKFLHKCNSVSIEEAIQAVEAAEKAFPAWRDTLPNKRRDIFLKAASIVENRAAELGKYMEEETGSNAFWAEGFNVPVSVDSLKDIAGRIGGLAGSIPTMTDADRTALIFKEPYGVVMGIAPWNAPYILGFRSIAYAIAAGNTAILKASESSPRCSWAIGDCFREAGLPEGVLNVIAHKPSDAAAVTKALIEHPSLKKLNFTGSTMVGRIIGRLAGENLKPVLQELGGKAPAIVWEDADLKLAAHECAVGAFLHTGQVCMATERIIVHKNVAGQFQEELNAAVKEMFSEAGTMVNKLGVEKNKHLVKDALSKGATLVYGSVEAQELETRMSAVILKDVTPQMDIYMTESFGPSVSMYVIETEEEALKLANDTEYGLHAAIFTEDLRRALRMAKNIETGAVHVNAMTIHDEPALPHGGVKGSGYGRFGSTGMDEWVRTKTVTFKK